MTSAEIQSADRVGWSMQELVALNIPFGTLSQSYPFRMHRCSGHVFENISQPEFYPTTAFIW